MILQKQQFEDFSHRFLFISGDKGTIKWGENQIIFGFSRSTKGTVLFPETVEERSLNIRVEFIAIPVG